MARWSLLLLLLAACGPETGGERPDAGNDQAAPAPDGSAPVITPGIKGHLLLQGTIVTPDQIIVGQVLVEGTMVTCVAEGNGCANESGAIGATVIDTHGIIAPGLIDTHNHILFDIFDDDDWKPPQVYQNHDQWT